MATSPLPALILGIPFWKAAILHHHRVRGKLLLALPSTSARLGWRKSLKECSVLTSNVHTKYFVASLYSVLRTPYLRMHSSCKAPSDAWTRPVVLAWFVLSTSLYPTTRNCPGGILFCLGAPRLLIGQSASSPRTNCMAQRNSGAPSPEDLIRQRCRIANLWCRRPRSPGRELRGANGLKRPCVKRRHHLCCPSCKIGTGTPHNLPRCADRPTPQ